MTGIRNGTDDIIAQLQLSDSILHRTSGRESFSGCVSHYFQWLESSVGAMWNADVDLLLYQAGADTHIDAPLGGLLDDDAMFGAMQSFSITAAQSH